MKQFFAFAIIAALIVACGGNDKKDTSTAENTTASTPAVASGPSGEKLYKQYCVVCHGVYGDMGASGAANLAESKLSLDERIKVLHTGRPGTQMVSFTSVLKDEANVKAVAEYTLKLKK